MIANTLIQIDKYNSRCCLGFSGNLKPETRNRKLWAAVAYYLFTYGTLKSGLTPPEVAAILRRLTSLGTGIVLGTLYDLGRYPGLRLDGAGEVLGEVFEFQDPAILKALDAYEGCDPNRPSRSLFVRKQCQVRLSENDKDLLCWVYEYNRQPGSSQRIPFWPSKPNPRSP